MAQLQRPYVILCALEFDETGDLALGEAVRIASCVPNTELHVMHVAPDLGAVQSDTPTSIRKSLVDQAPALLEERVKRACPNTTLEIRGRIRRGTPVEAILLTAVEIDADLLVIGSHRRRGMEKLMLGSVAESILREAHCPVLTALPKAWHHLETVEIEGACPDCLQARHAIPPAQWCERHSGARHHPHVYTPSGAPSGVILWT